LKINGTEYEITTSGVGSDFLLESVHPEIDESHPDWIALHYCAEEEAAIAWMYGRERI